MKKSAVICCIAAALGFTADAETLLWYRFDGDGATIVNKANPGTMDGTLKSIVWGQGVDNQGNDSTKFPVRGDAFPEGVGIIDPATDSSYSGQVRSLSFAGDQSTAGMVLLKKANAAPLVNLTSFTCEVFFKIPEEATSRNPALFPLVNWGEDQKQGWKFGFFRQNGKLSPWFRGVTKKADGTANTTITINSANDNKDNYGYGSWHHLAVVVNGAGDGSAATAKLILDYTEVQTLPISSYYGFYFNASGAFPLTIGADMYRNRDTATSRETFMGDIAEFRISNTALAANQLLRPLPAGPVDADTLVYLPMGDSDWFGSPNLPNYKNIYHGILNAAPTASCTPYWLFNTSSSVLYPEADEDAIGENVRGGYFATTSYRDLSSMLFSRALISDQYQGHVVLVPYESAGLANGSFTIEWFFKTDDMVTSGNSINTYTLLYNSFAKILINQENGLLLTRLTPASGNTTDYNSEDRVDDGGWHHYAFVYDKQQSAFSVFLDYRKIVSGTYTLTTSTAVPFSFGGYGRQAQGFAGNLDDFRITKRALTAGEFLTTRAVSPSGAALLSHFDNSLSTGVDDAYAPDGVGGTLGGGSAPTYVNSTRRIDLDGDGRSDYMSTKALRLDGGSVVYPHNPLLECRDFTVEWFAKYESVADVSMLLRLGMESDSGTGTMCWALYKSGNTLRFGAQITADGSWHSPARKDKNFVETGVDAVLVDGKWHHWALVAETHADATPANTTFKLYKDCVQVGNALVFDRDGAGGILALPSTGTTLSIGTGGKRLVGRMDELLFRPEALSSESFMRRLPCGFVMMMK